MPRLPTVVRVTRPASRPDPRFRYRLVPGTPVTIEVRCCDGSCATVRGTVDGVREGRAIWRGGW